MKKKFIITTTIPATFVFFKDNLKFLNQYYEVCAISSEKKNLEDVGKSEGVRTYYIPMVRPISLVNDILSLWRFFQFFVKERPDIVHGNTPKASLLSMLAAKIAGVKIRIYMCHGLRYQGTIGVMRWLLVQMEKITSYCATEVICVSHGVRNALYRSSFGRKTTTEVMCFRIYFRILMPSLHKYIVVRVSQTINSVNNIFRLLTQ